MLSAIWARAAQPSLQEVKRTAEQACGAAQCGLTVTHAASESTRAGNDVAHQDSNCQQPRWVRYSGLKPLHLALGQSSSLCNPASLCLPKCSIWHLPRYIERPWPRLSVSKSFDSTTRLLSLPRSRARQPSRKGGSSPTIWQELRDVGVHLGRESRKDVFQVGVRIIPIERRPLDLIHDYGRTLARVDEPAGSQTQ